MKKQLTFVIALALIVPLMGCGTIPANRISIHAPSGDYDLKMPKNVDVEGLNASVSTNGTFTVSFDSWVSTNDPKVIDSAAQLETARWNGIQGTIGKISEAAGTLSGAAAKTAVVP